MDTPTWLGTPCFEGAQPLLLDFFRHLDIVLRSRIESLPTPHVYGHDDVFEVPYSSLGDCRDISVGGLWMSWKWEGQAESRPGHVFNA